MTLPMNITVAEVVAVPFRDGEVLAVDHDGKPYVILKPAFEAIGLDADQQVRKIQRQHWARTVVTPVRGTDGRPREMVTADVRTFLMALATIPVARVAESAQQTLMDYQNEVADVIEAYWTQGGAINPRATEDQLTILIGRAEGQARVLRALSGIVDARWLEAKGRHVAARALGEEPEVPDDTRPLTVGEYLEDKGVTGAALRSISPRFGGKLKRLFIEQFGYEPGKTDRFVDGAIRGVAVYTEAQRSLFDQVWATYVAGRGGMKNTRLSGHALPNEGRLGGWPMSAQNGRGKATCSCGAESPELESTAKRKQWHKDHKDDIRAGGDGVVWQGVA